MTSPWMSCINAFAAAIAEGTRNFSPRKASWKASAQLSAVGFLAASTRSVPHAYSKEILLHATEK